MTVLETLRNTVNTAVDTIQTVTQTVVEKNRTNAKLNRLRFIMKNESELMNRAYIALGKQFYEKQKTGETISAENVEKLVSVIDSSKSKIAKARECYKKIVDNQNDIFTEKTEPVKNNIAFDEIVDITVACSNESEYKSSPFSAEEEAVDNNAFADAPMTTETEGEFSDDVAKAENIALDSNSDLEDTEDELF